MSPAGGHLGFSIGPKSNNTWLAACNDHSWQFSIHPPCSIGEEDHSKFQPIRGFYGPWQPCWITDHNESNNTWLDHANEHFATFGPICFSGSLEEDWNVYGWTDGELKSNTLFPIYKLRHLQARDLFTRSFYATSCYYKHFGDCYMKSNDRARVRFFFVAFNATFDNISVILRQSSFIAGGYWST